MHPGEAQRYARTRFLEDRIVIDPAVRRGKPCKDTGVTAYDVPKCLASGRLRVFAAHGWVSSGRHLPDANCATG